MSSKRFRFSIGGLQPFLFAFGMYLVALFISIFICTAIFNSLTSKGSPRKESEGVKTSESDAATKGGKLLVSH